MAAPEGSGRRRAGSTLGYRPQVGSLDWVSDQPKPPKWDEPEQAPPYEPGQGDPPRRRRWPIGHQPGLSVRVNGRWRIMQVSARLDYPDGRVAYQGVIALPSGSGPPQHYHRSYWWPQPGKLRPAYGSDMPPR